MDVGWNESNRKQINLSSNKGIDRSTNLYSYFSAIIYIIESVSYIHNVLNQVVNYSMEVELIFVESFRTLLNRTVFQNQRCTFTTENKANKL